MPHLHYSPFQFATGVQVSEDAVNVPKLKKVMKELTKKDTSKTKDMKSTMSVSEAAKIPGTPNAFISPNTPDVMRSVHNVIDSIVGDVSPVAAHIPDERHSQRKNNKNMYNDRAY